MSKESIREVLGSEPAITMHPMTLEFGTIENNTDNKTWMECILSGCLDALNIL